MCFVVLHSSPTEHCDKIHAMPPFQQTFNANTHTHTYQKANNLLWRISKRKQNGYFFFFVACFPRVFSSLFSFIFLFFVGSFGTFLWHFNIEHIYIGSVHKHIYNTFIMRIANIVHKSIQNNARKEKKIIGNVASFQICLCACKVFLALSTLFRAHIHTRFNVEIIIVSSFFCNNNNNIYFYYSTKCLLLVLAF